MPATTCPSHVAALGGKEEPMPTKLMLWKEMAQGHRLARWDDGGKPLIRHPLGDLPVPIYKSAQMLRAPRGWISRTVGPP